MHLSSDPGLATSLNRTDNCLVIYTTGHIHGRPARMIKSKLLVEIIRIYTSFIVYIH